MFLSNPIKSMLAYHNEKILLLIVYSILSITWKSLTSHFAKDKVQCCKNASLEHSNSGEMKSWFKHHCASVVDPEWIWAPPKDIGILPLSLCALQCLPSTCIPPCPAHCYCCPQLIQGQEELQSHSCPASARLHMETNSAGDRGSRLWGLPPCLVPPGVPHQPESKLLGRRNHPPLLQME